MGTRRAFSMLSAEDGEGRARCVRTLRELLERMRGGNFGGVVIVSRPGPERAAVSVAAFMGLRDKVPIFYALLGGLRLAGIIDDAWLRAFAEAGPARHGEMIEEAMARARVKPAIDMGEDDNVMYG